MDSGISFSLSVELGMIRSLCRIGQIVLTLKELLLLGHFWCTTFALHNYGVGPREKHICEHAEDISNH